MPELPEAETIRCQLEGEIVGAAVRRLQIHDRRVARAHKSPEDLTALVQGRPIVGVGRRGKAPLLFLDGERPATLVFRLGMTGLLRVVPSDEPLAKGTVAALVLTGGKHLRFLDQRRFGSMVAYPTREVDRTPEFEHYGPEPFSGEFTAEYLKSAFSRRSAKLGIVLMDQRVIAGIGKIYSDEICFRAGIRPGRSAGRLTGPMRERLWQATREVLSEGIDCRGSSARDETYRDIYGIPGTFQERMFVYQRTGEPCRVCGAPIRRTPIPGGRGMHWCPKCQK
ncbi:MAG: bifunctional DNA-formamidopyrimidine glycosylase/DNA-(apurinic or apyrimidinic site) lyase [Armatimonadota bacterium]|nr:MAG: bifunctional DNA-formamidopyrimidine glycosylase/DNA-(apurinic or apyrimidinic site) lyase [Armatimonadota bacterium]